MNRRKVMLRTCLLPLALVCSLVSAADELDMVINEIFFLHDAESRWNQYAADSVRQKREAMVYPELYQEELDGWLQNELSWAGVEPLFRNEMKSRYTVDELLKIADSLRDNPSGYPEDSNVKGYGPELFNIGAAVAQQVYPSLNARLAELRARNEIHKRIDKPGATVSRSSAQESLTDY